MGLRYILLNGPPDSGKDYIADLAVQKLGYHKEELKRPLYEMCRLATGMTDFETKARNRYTKDIGLIPYGNTKVSPRKFMQIMAEEIIKPAAGKDIFARMLYERTKHLSNTVIVSDAGLPEEVLPNSIVIRVIRPKTDFSLDTRKYLPTRHTIHNTNNILEQLVTEVQNGFN